MTTMDAPDLLRRTFGPDPLRRGTNGSSNSTQRAKRPGPMRDGEFDRLPLRRTEGDLLQRQPLSGPAQDESAPFDIDRAQREQQRLETMLRSLDRRIMGQRQQARRDGTVFDDAPDLLRRGDLKDQLRRTTRALRPVQNTTTPEEVMAKRADLQRQGLEQARGDLSRATAGPSPERLAQVRAAVEAEAVAAARARQQPGGNVPANELLPSNLSRVASGTLAREQSGAIDSATRRIDAFERFGFTPEQAETRAAEANAGAERRNTERADAQAALARTFADRDAEEAATDARLARVQAAEEERKVAAIIAQRRAFDQVGQPSAEEALRERLLTAQVTQEEVAARRAQADLDAQLGVSNSPDPLAGAEFEALNDPAARRAAIIAMQREAFGAGAEVSLENLIATMEAASSGGFDVEQARANGVALATAMTAIRKLPDPLRQEVASDALLGITPFMGRDAEGSVGQFLAGAIGEVTDLEFEFTERGEANDAMRRVHAQFVAELQRLASVDVVESPAPDPATLEAVRRAEEARAVAAAQASRQSVRGADLPTRPAWARGMTDAEWARTVGRTVQHR